MPNETEDAAKAALAQRIAGRKEFQALVQLAVDPEVDPHWLDGFVRAARDFVYEQQGPPDGLVVMSQEEAVRYGKRLMAFGEYEGTKISETPIERLAWYGDAAVPLQAYLRSVVGQRRIDDGK